jgi:hypothetical protein
LARFQKARALFKEVASKGRKEQRHHIEAKLGHPMTESEWRRLKRKNPRQQGPQPKSN